MNIGWNHSWECYYIWRHKCNAITFWSVPYNFMYHKIKSYLLFKPIHSEWLVNLVHSMKQTYKSWNWHYACLLASVATIHDQFNRIVYINNSASIYMFTFMLAWVIGHPQAISSHGTYQLYQVLLWLISHVHPTPLGCTGKSLGTMIQLLHATHETMWYSAKIALVLLKTTQISRY